MNDVKTCYLCNRVVKSELLYTVYEITSSEIFLYTIVLVSNAEMITHLLPLSLYSATSRFLNHNYITNKVKELKLVLSGSQELLKANVVDGSLHALYVNLKPIWLCRDCNLFFSSANIVPCLTFYSSIILQGYGVLRENPNSSNSIKYWLFETTFILTTAIYVA